ncbi:chaperone protein Skp [Leminorella grimontii]|uniref:Chaperone protein Skp n=1 Tax=Leminorella grimontii TaxID=82981 RepID=A0AAV5N343_9GAMM|nr:OmpH family outer membrane protein [Leminorella grimontii]GKX55328.1 chaperone protein Skp [Leminorella grimontii]GKX58746.1 chaperone protein Skp [Leminorella grimontii]
MKKWLCAAGLGLAMVASGVAQAADKVAVVDVMQVLQKMPEREAIAKKLEGEFKSRAADLQKEEKTAQDNVKKLQTKGASMKAAERTKIENDIKAFQQKAAAFTQDSRRRESEEMNKLVAKVQAAVKTVADKEGYAVVVKSDAAFYSNAENDITEKVLAQVK